MYIYVCVRVRVHVRVRVRVRVRLCMYVCIANTHIYLNFCALTFHLTCSKVFSHMLQL